MWAAYNADAITTSCFCNSVLLHQGHLKAPFARGMVCSHSTAVPIQTKGSPPPLQNIVHSSQPHNPNQ